MATDFILEDDSARVADGDLDVDRNLRVQGMLEVRDHRDRPARLRSNRLELLPNGDDGHGVTLSSSQLSGVHVVAAERMSCKTVNAVEGDLTRLSLGNASEIDGNIPTPGELTLTDRNGDPTMTMTGASGAIHFHRPAISRGDGSMIYVYQDRPATGDDDVLRPIDEDIILPGPRVDGPLHDAVINDDLRQRPEFPRRPGGVVDPDPRPLRVLKESIAAEMDAGAPVLGQAGPSVKSPIFDRPMAVRTTGTARLDQGALKDAVNADSIPAIPEGVFDLMALTSIISHSEELPDWGLAYHPAQRMIFQGGGRTALAVDLHGKIGVGMDDPRYPLHVNGLIAATEPLQALADARCMSNPAPIEGALEKVRALEGVSFEWDSEELPDLDAPAGRRYGFVAQQVETVLPEAVSLSDNEAYSVSGGAIVPVLVEAMKQQQAVIDDLTQRIQVLEVQHDAAVVEP